jgi:probable HAF family extracellular repeat protein
VDVRINEKLSTVHRLLRGAAIAATVAMLQVPAQATSNYVSLDLGAGLMPTAITDSGIVAGNTGGNQAFLTDGRSPQRILSGVAGYSDWMFPGGAAHDADGGGVWLAGRSYTDSWEHAGYRWNSAQSSMTQFRAPSKYAVANGVNRAGDVVGSYQNSDGTLSAFVYANWGGGTQLHLLPTFGGTRTTQMIYTGANAINDHGLVVGSLPDGDNNDRAFVFKDGAMSDIGPGRAIAVTNGGLVLVADGGTGGETGVLYNIADGSSRELGAYGQYHLYGLNRWGQIIGMRYSLGGPIIPFIWERGTFHDLRPLIPNVPANTIFYPTAINDNGQIAGWGSYPGQGTSAYALLLTPATGTSPFYPQTAPQDPITVTASFSAAPSGKWFAPDGRVPAASPGQIAPEAAQSPDPSPAYQYNASGKSRFADIQDFPDGFASPFTVAVDAIVLGTFAPGDHVHFPDFADKLGQRLQNGGVQSFTVNGILPLADLAEVPRFALQLAFADGQGDFSIHSRNTLLGDADGDGAASYADFVVLKEHLADTPASWFGGDFDLDGTVGASDFDLWRRNVTGPLSPDELADVNRFAAQLPEPGTACWILLLAAPYLRRERRRAALTFA